MLRAAELADDYAAAFREWDASKDASIWELGTGDGLTGR